MPGRIDVQGLTKQWGAVTALGGVNLEASPGELLAVIGPSGSGKTTLLRAIAGLERPNAGSIAIDGVDLGPLGPSERPVGMVFQTDTLFAELSVRENVAFGLRARRQQGADAAEKVEVALLRLGILGLADRYPDELSGGQRRRVALAGALVLQPAALLLDEPLSGLDDALRPQLVTLIRGNQRRFGITTLYVTHDQDEALSIADRVVVMQAGRIAQVGTPREVYERPGSEFVASFVGRANLVVCQVVSTSSGHAVVAVLGAEVRLPRHPDVQVGEGLAVLRPEQLRLSAAPARPAWADVTGDAGQVVDVHYYGSRLDYSVETEHGVLTVAGDPRDVPLEVGLGVRVSIAEGSGWVLP